MLGAELGGWGVGRYLSHHGLLVLLLLRDLNGRQLCNSGHQEVHQDVLAVGQLVHHVLQTGGDELGVEIMVIPVWWGGGGGEGGTELHQMDDQLLLITSSANLTFLKGRTRVWILTTQLPVQLELLVRTRSS